MDEVDAWLPDLETESWEAGQLLIATRDSPTGYGVIIDDATHTPTEEFSSFMLAFPAWSRTTVVINDDQLSTMLKVIGIPSPEQIAIQHHQRKSKRNPLTKTSPQTNRDLQPAKCHYRVSTTQTFALKYHLRKIDKCTPCKTRLRLDDVSKSFTPPHLAKVTTN